jgi:hypothetical protein
MTEEDTFRVLSQTPYIHLYQIALHALPRMDNVEEAEDFFSKHGWTLDEFYNHVLRND